MDLTAVLEAPCSRTGLYSILSDLGRYPEWLDFVGAAESAGTAGENEPAWAVTLRARVGPFTREKRLRMVRTVHQAPDRVRFERRELDGRSHADWRLDAQLSENGGTTALTVRLHYDGSLWVPSLDRILNREIEKSRPRLVALARAEG